MTGLGTPVANLLVPDLVAYQSGTFVASGPTVGPLQDSTLVGTGSSGGGTNNVFSVFSALTSSSNNLGVPAIQSTRGNASGLQLEILGVASNQSVVASSPGTSTSVTASTGWLLPDPGNLGAISGLAARPIGLLQLPSIEIAATLYRSRWARPASLGSRIFARRPAGRVTRSTRLEPTPFPRPCRTI